MAIVFRRTLIGRSRLMLFEPWADAVVRGMRREGHPGSATWEAAPIGTVLTETTMSLFLPPEILDNIVDHLHNEPTTLRACCLVSKSWIPRTRIHLFNRVELRSSGPTLNSWMKAFPDPSNSPAHYTRDLDLSRPEVVAVAISYAHPWVHAFNHIVHLRVATVGVESDRHVSFARLRGLSPTLKSLSLFYSFVPLSELFDLVFSFPLLEDLSLCSVKLYTQEIAEEWNAPPISPKFTGSLVLSGHNRYITRKLVDLPGGLRFSKIEVSCAVRDCHLAKELVSACSDTLESLCIHSYHGAFSMAYVADQYPIPRR